MKCIPAPKEKIIKSSRHQNLYPGRWFLVLTRNCEIIFLISARVAKSVINFLL